MTKDTLVSWSINHTYGSISTARIRALSYITWRWQAKREWRELTNNKSRQEMAMSSFLRRRKVANPLENTWSVLSLSLSCCNFCFFFFCDYLQDGWIWKILQDRRIWPSLVSQPSREPCKISFAFFSSVLQSSVPSVRPFLVLSWWSARLAGWEDPPRKVYFAVTG